MCYYRCRKWQMITWGYCGTSNAHWHVTVQFRAKIKFMKRQNFYSAYKCKSKCLSSDIPESLVGCTNFCNLSTGTHSIIVSSLGDSEISGTIQHVLFCQAPTTAEWEEAEWNEFTWHFYMTKLWESNLRPFDLESNTLSTRPNAPRLFCYHLSRFFKASNLGNCTFHDSNHLFAFIFYCNSLYASPFAQQLHFFVFKL